MKLLRGIWVFLCDIWNERNERTTDGGPGSYDPMNELQREVAALRREIAELEVLISLK